MFRTPPVVSPLLKVQSGVYGSSGSGSPSYDATHRFCVSANLENLTITQRTRGSRWSCELEANFKNVDDALEFASILKAKGIECRVRRGRVTAEAFYSGDADAAPVLRLAAREALAELLGQMKSHLGTTNASDIPDIAQKLIA